MASRKNKRKIINDPVHGFIKIPSDLLFDLIEHPFVQRLRRIRQLGLTHLVYPGALHTRFQHALGAMHLMSSAIEVLRGKQNVISEQEAQAVCAAILLHDVGHGPFSHVLEDTIIENVSHEQLSSLIMNRLNQEFENALEMAIDVFNGNYPRQFFRQLVTGQLDMDRLDYLRRDSFFSGVTEGVIGSERIIKMLNVLDDKLVVEAKGVYSIEKFLVARRFMYWQVYLHKTALAAEKMLVSLLSRARSLALTGSEVFAPPHLDFFLRQRVTLEDFEFRPEVLENFMWLDDDDIMSSIKVWVHHPDPILAQLSKDFINRKLFHIEIRNTPFETEELTRLKQQVAACYHLKSDKEADFMFFDGVIANNAYSLEEESINILYHDKSLKDITEASDMLNLTVLGKTNRKYYVCYPKSVAT
jgi:HD superfamily phosphohydrolase